MYFLIDDEGYYIDYVLEIESTDDEGEGSGEDKAPRFVTVRPPDGLYRARWIAETSEWIETKTAEEFQLEESLRSLEPTRDEIAEAEFEIKTLNILMEVGLI